MKVAWVTGARGFIGRHLSRRLAESGAEVAGVGHGAWSDEDAKRWGVRRWINGEILHANLDRMATQSGLPEVIFHLAGGSSVGLSLNTPEEDFRRTVDSTVQVLEWVRNRAPGTRVVFASSAAVYGGGHELPILEKGAIVPYSPYGYHKRMAELLCESYAHNFGIGTAVVRLFSVYGPGLRKQLLWELSSRLKAGPQRIELGGTGQELRDWLHVGDAVEFLLCAARSSSVANLVLNGGTGEAIAVHRIAECVLRAWGLDLDIHFSGIARPGDPKYLVADVERARSLGMVPTMRWEDGIAAYVAWFRVAGADGTA